MTNSKNKGNSYERDVAKKLSLWVSKGKDPHIFARRSGSGGAFRDKSGSTGITGDIFADKPEGKFFTDKFNIECKFYRDLTNDLWKMVLCKPNKIYEFIEQAKEEAELHNRRYLLIVKSNRIGEVIFTDNALFAGMVGNASLFPYKDGEKIYAISFDDLLKTEVDDR